MINFKPAEFEDALTIIKTRQKVWASTYRGIYPEHEIDCFNYDWHLKAEQRRLSNPGFQCYLVMDADKCVGYFSYGTVRPGTWKDFGFRLHSLYLLPQYRGTGLGKLIFQQVKSAALSAGYTRFYLDCHPQNENALGFYVHMGGRITDLDAGHENPMEDSCTIEYDFT